MADKKLKMVRVKGAGKADNKVLLFERHVDHPRPFGHENDEIGEVFVVNDGRVYLVAETAAVKRLLGEGVLTTELTGKEVDAEAQRVNWNSAPLRPATESEEDAAGLETPTEKQTAVVPEQGGIRKGGRPS